MSPTSRDATPKNYSCFYARKDKKSRHSNWNRRCFCESPQCHSIAQRYRALGDVQRTGYFSIPKWRKQPSYSAGKKNHAKKMAQRAVMFRHLRGPGKAGQHHNKPPHTTAQYYFAKWHVHPRILSMCSTTAQNHVVLPTEVSADVAKELNNRGFSYTRPDKIDNECYFVAPNYTIQHALDELNAREDGRREPAVLRETDAARFTTPITPCDRSRVKRLDEDASGRTVFTLEQKVNHLQCLLDEEAASKEALVKKLAAKEQEVQQLQQQLIDSVPKLQVQEQVEAALLDVYDRFLVHQGGLCRLTLWSDVWHKNNPEAASHLFGFDSWKATKLHVWSMYLLKPPVADKPFIDAGSISEFEKCLLAKLRIHRGLPMETLAYICNRSRPSVSGYMQEWLPKWGCAGEQASH